MPVCFKYVSLNLVQTLPELIVKIKIAGQSGGKFELLIKNKVLFLFC
jgi:hypothetical protein